MERSDEDDALISLKRARERVDNLSEAGQEVTGSPDVDENLLLAMRRNAQHAKKMEEERLKANRLVLRSYRIKV